MGGLGSVVLVVVVVGTYWYDSFYRGRVKYRRLPYATEWWRKRYLSCSTRPRARTVVPTHNVAGDGGRQGGNTS
ncbi:hypothetical protein HOY80DRAFT_966351 [Tuber brumale]|nr:hypothetical protein HOY80DRAFT_966351 [Tuber brumale]